MLKGIFSNSFNNERFNDSTLACFTAILGFQVRPNKIIQRVEILERWWLIFWDKSKQIGLTPLLSHLRGMKWSPVLLECPLSSGKDGRIAMLHNKLENIIGIDLRIQSHP